MEPRLIIDAHEDIAYNALHLGRDFFLPVQEKRAREGESPVGGIATVSLPDLLRGNVRVVFATIYAQPASASSVQPGPCYSTPEEADALAREQLGYYAMLATDPRISLITTRADLQRVIDSHDPKIGMVVLMEGADPIIAPENARDWYDAGVRIVGPSWGATRYAGGTQAPGPLTKLGRALMRELERNGFILDTSHMAEESFFQALELFGGTVIASHSNARALVPSDRHLSDDMIRAIVARDGVIGVVLYNRFLRPDWSADLSRKDQVTLADVVTHVGHICELAGDTRHVGIGTDFDGGFGMEKSPREIDTVADLQKVADALTDANMSDDDIENILSQNWLRVLRRALPD